MILFGSPRISRRGRPNFGGETSSPKSGSAEDLVRGEIFVKCAFRTEKRPDRCMEGSKVVFDLDEVSGPRSYVW